MRDPIRSQRGGALLVVMALLGMGALLSTALLRITAYSRQQTRRTLVQRQADYSAMAGIEAALADIRQRPERYLKSGATWAPLEGAPAELDFQVKLSESNGIYTLTSQGGSAPNQVVYTVKLKKGNPFSDYAVALGSSGGTGFVLDPSAKRIAVEGGPVYMEGDFYINQNEKKSYPFIDGFPVIVAGRAHIGQNDNHDRDLTAEDLGASDLIAGATSLGLDQLLPDTVDYLMDHLDPQNPQGPVLAYNPQAWGIYASPSPRIVVVDGSLGCDSQSDWGSAGENQVQEFYGTLIVKGKICEPSNFKGLEVHGSLLAGGMELNAKQTALRIVYSPDYIPPVLAQIPKAGGDSIVVMSTEVEH